MKSALVLEGGASRSLFGVGVTDILLKNGIYTDLVVGSSAGIANGVSYVSRQYGRARDIAVRYSSDKRYMGFRHLVNPSNRSYYNIPFVFEQIPNEIEPFDYEALQNSKCEAYACVTNIQSAEAEFLRVDAHDKTWKSLVATCALPLLFSPIEINGTLYMDGGIADSVPVDFALHAECDRILCILTRERGYQKKDTDLSLNIASRFYHKYPKFAELLKSRNRLYNQSRRTLYQLEKEGKIMIIEPDEIGKFKRTEKDPQKLNEIYRQGAKIASSRLEQIRNYLCFGR